MNLKRIMLVTFVLLTILTLGAVSAVDDDCFNQTLTVDNIEEVSTDASLDDEVISEDNSAISESLQSDVISLNGSEDDVISSYENDNEIVKSNNADYSNENTFVVTAKNITVGEVAVIDCSFVGNPNARAQISISAIHHDDIYNPEHYEYTINFSDSSHKTIEIPNLRVGGYWISAICSVASDFSCQSYFTVVSPTENTDFELFELETPALNIYNISNQIYINLNDTNHYYDGRPMVVSANVNGRWFRNYGSNIGDYGQWATNHYSGYLGWYNQDLGLFSGDVEITAWYDYPIGQYKNGNLRMGRITNTNSFSFNSPVEFIFPTGPLAFENDTRVVSVRAPENTNGTFVFKFEDLSFGGTLEDLRYSAEENLYYLLIGDFVSYTQWHHDYNLLKLQNLAVNNETYLWCGAEYHDNYSDTIDESRILFHKLNLTIHAVNVKDTIVISLEDENGRLMGDMYDYGGRPISNWIEYTINGGSTQWISISKEKNVAIIRNLEPGNIELNVHSDAGGSYQYPSHLYHFAYDTFTFKIRANPKVNIKANDCYEGNLTHIEFGAQEDISGTVIICIDGENHTAQLNNGYGSLNISLAPGYHNATFIFEGNDDYYDNESYTKFAVYSNSRLDPNLTVVINNTGRLMENVPISIIITADDNLTDKIPYKYRSSIYHGYWVGSDMNGRIEINNGYASINQTYECGTYTYEFKFDGNPFYNPGEARISFNVYRMPISTNFMYLEYSNGGYAIGLYDLFGTAVPDAVISYTIDNVTSTMVNGDELNLSGITEPCDIFFKYDGNETYDGCNYTLRYRMNPNLNIVADESIPENTQFTITITANEDINGTVYVWLQNSYPVDLVNGFVQVNISGLENGDYWCYAEYYGNENYSYSSKSVQIHIGNASPENNTDGEMMTVNQDEIITNPADAGYNPDTVVATFKDSSIRRIVIRLRDEEIFLFNRTVMEEDFAENGYEIALKDLNLADVADKDNIKIVCFDGDDNELENYTRYYSVKITDNTIQLLNESNQTQSDLELAISVDDISYGSTAVAVITTDKAFSGNVTFLLGDKNYNAVITNGAGKVTIPGLNAGTYTAKAIFTADEVFKASEKTASFTVNKLATKVSASKVITTYGTSKKLVVTLKDKNGKVLAGKTVTVKLNNKKYSPKTNAKGQVSISVPNNLASKTYTATISFAGDKNYAASSGSVKVAVGKATPKITAKAKTFKVKVKTKKYTVTLKTDKGKPMNKIKLTLKIKGKTYTATSNNKGQATFKITKFTKTGKLTANVIFAGNKNYNAVTKKIKIIVEK